MSVETMAALSRLPRIRGVKDATGDLVRPLKQRVASGPKFCMLDGDDASAIAFNAHGGTGCISVTVNIAPKLRSEERRVGKELVRTGRYRGSPYLYKNNHTLKCVDI